MNFLKRKVRYNTACAENTEKRVKSQVKRHSIITKVHKSYFSPTLKFRPLPFFFYLRQNFEDLRDPQDLCQSLTHATHEPTHQHYPRLPRYLTDS